MRRILVLALSLVAPLLFAQQTLNNDAVIKLAKSGLSDDLIITTVNASPGNYDTSADGLIALKSGGVSDKVVAAILLKASGGAPPAGSAPASAPPAGPSKTGGLSPVAGASSLAAVPPAIKDVGIYYQDQDTGSWLGVDPETVSIKSSGSLKHIASAGIEKKDLNGMITGTRSRLGLKMPANFILYLPEGLTPSDYQLLRFRLTPTTREFRATAGGSSHESGGDVRDTVDYTVKKIAQRVYAVTLGQDVGNGEYGFLPPLDSTKNVAPSGKIYTFTLLR